MSYQFETENLKMGGHSWGVTCNRADLYYGITKRNKWKRILTFYFDNVQKFYDSPLYKNRNYVKEILKTYSRSEKEGGAV